MNNNNNSISLEWSSIFKYNLRVEFFVYYNEEWKFSCLCSTDNSNTLLFRFKLWRNLPSPWASPYHTPDHHRGSVWPSARPTLHYSLPPSSSPPLQSAHAHPQLNKLGRVPEPSHNSALMTLNLHSPKLSDCLYSKVINNPILLITLAITVATICNISSQLGF